MTGSRAAPAGDPVIEIDVGVIEGNTRAIVDLCAGHGIEVMGVTKAVFGHPEVAAAMLRGGVTSVGDSRLDSLARLRDGGVEAPLALLRAPSWSRLDEAVAVVDMGLHTEAATIERLGAAAVAAGRVHEVMVMVDLGDRREGVLPDDLVALARDAAAVPGIRVVGVGTNLTCLTGVAPSPENVATFVGLVDAVEDEIGVPVRWVSAGNSSSLEMMAAGALPARVNQLRIGEGILLGRETLHRRAWPGTRQDAVVVWAEVVELRDKPPAPPGPRADPAFVRAPRPRDEQGRRALVALGRADVEIEGLTPITAGQRLVGASSDYLVVDVTESEVPVDVGDELAFMPDYGALVTAVGSVGVAPRIVGK